ncbi:MAG: 4'-phosphopantetheinyl transferase superfamily protein [Candidatus Ancillula sp.]|jgi:holo-[acyl-carrier protein] synthase|nr:4'-phosphopantetheinyl transferase superfamily protein [Candidatus Ancillula sp.]
MHSSCKHSVGLDIVDVQAFTKQLEIPGSSFREVFTALELSDAREMAKREGDFARENIHLAGKWAAKEAFVKAWSNLLISLQPPIKQNLLVFSEIQVQKDIYQRAFIKLSGEVLEKFKSSLSISHGVSDIQTVDISTSISHDGNYATAICSILLVDAI